MSVESTSPMLIGKSQAILQILKMIDKVADTDSTVLLTGESGTGKELAAHQLHNKSSRFGKPMLTVNCSAFSDTLLESELFGYRKGSFTGASQSKPGLFLLADQGTLFLDEVSEMSEEMQKKLLRVLEDGEVRPVGAQESIRSNVRIIAATNRNLKQMAQQKKFRDDLYFRLNVISIEIPPLRKRKEDIPLLMDFYTKKICGELKRAVIQTPPEIRDIFMSYSWPGNVRELVNELRKWILLQSQYSFDEYQPDDLPELPDAPSTDKKDSMTLDSLERKSIIEALKTAEGNKTKAAKLLGVARRTLYQKLKRHKI